MKSIDITGQDGNALSLIGYAKSFAKQLNMDGNAITKEMMAGDYESFHDCKLQAKEHGLFGDRPIRIEQRFKYFTESEGF